MNPNLEISRGSEKPTATLPVEELRTLHALAIHGYNAELRFKSYRRFKGERASEFAMRKADEQRAIENSRPLVARPEMDPPKAID